MKSLCHVGRYNSKTSLPHCPIFRSKSAFTFPLPVSMTEAQRAREACAGKQGPGKTSHSCHCLAPLCPSCILKPPLPSTPSLAEGCWLTLPAQRAQAAPGGIIRSILVQPRSSEVKVLWFGFPPRRVITPPPLGISQLPGKAHLQTSLFKLMLPD